VILRPAQPDEYAEVGELTLAAYVADGYLDNDADYAADLRGAERRAVEAELMVAVDRDSDDLLGTVTYAVSGSPYAEISQPGEAEFRMLAVTPAARGRGIGLALVHWCIEQARAQGHRALVLSSLDRMHTAHRLYERIGFTRMPERDWAPAPNISLIAYRLELES
jgi:GNAT superfamily N-acetyltransferase